MDYKVEFTLALPDELLDTLGINEDTLFEAYFDEGKIKVRILDEEITEDDFGNENFEERDEVPEECIDCPHYCRRCGVCTLED